MIANEAQNSTDQAVLQQNQAVLQQASADPAVLQQAPADPALQRRKAPRFTCDGKAELCLNDSGAVLIGQLHDMSESGCMMISPARKPVQIGMAAQLFFSVPSGRFQIQATVRSTRPGQRIGLEFQFESERHRSEFNQLFYDIAH